MEIYADVACCLFAYPECFNTRLQRNNIWLDVVRLAILLVDGLKRRSDISIMSQRAAPGCLHILILQLRCVQSGDHFPNQRMRDMMLVCVGSLVTSKRP